MVSLAARRRGWQLQHQPQRLLGFAALTPTKGTIVGRNERNELRRMQRSIGRLRRFAPNRPYIKKGVLVLPLGCRDP